MFGLSSELASAMCKAMDALPESNRVSASDAAQRLLIEPEIDLLSRGQEAEHIPEAVVAEVLGAVLDAAIDDGLIAVNPSKRKRTVTRFADHLGKGWHFLTLLTGTTPTR